MNAYNWIQSLSDTSMTSKLKTNNLLQVIFNSSLLFTCRDRQRAALHCARVVCARVLLCACGFKVTFHRGEIDPEDVIAAFALYTHPLILRIYLELVWVSKGGELEEGSWTEVVSRCWCDFPAGGLSADPTPTPTPLDLPSSILPTNPASAEYVSLAALATAATTP